MIPLVAKVGLACLGALCVSGRSKPSLTVGPRRGQSRCRGRAQLRAELHEPTSTVPRYPPQTTPSMPWLADEVTACLNDALESGVKSSPALTAHALKTVYPKGVDGQTMSWPTCTGDCAEKLALESRVAIRADRLLAESRDIAADALWATGGGY